MSFNAGAFTPLYNWLNEANAGNPIDPTKFTAEETDIATGLSTCILKDGTQTITADIPWNGKKITGLGTATAGGDALSQTAGDARYGQITTGTYTGTLTGCTTSPTVTVNYQRVGNIVSLNMPTGVVATSNATTCTLTGAPAGIRPASTTGYITVTLVDSGALFIGQAQMQSDGTLKFDKSATNFTSSGTKGISAGNGLSLTYLVV